MLNRHVRKTPINQIGVVCTNTTVSQAKTKKRKQQTKRFSFEPLLAGASSGSFETHAPRCNPKSSTCRGSDSARLSFLRSASLITLALISVVNVFAAASFRQLPFTDPFPPASTPGNTTYCQPSAAVILNENTLGVTLPFTRALPAGWQSGLGAITIEFWLKQKPWTGNQSTDNPDGMLLHGPGFTVEANFQWGGAGTSGALICTFSQVKGSSFVAKRPIVIWLEQSDQQWHHYAVSYDLRTVRTYRDGELIDEKWLDNNTERIGPIEDDNGTIFANSLEVGTATGIPGGRPFQRGFLDSIRVSTIALSPWQVRRNFENARSYTRTLYVATGAADSGLGTEGSPTSLRTALGQVGANTRIILQAGTYSGSDFHVTRAALNKRDHSLITGADGSAPAIISGGTPTLSGANYVYLRNLTFSSDAGTALSVNNSTGAIVDSCRLSSSQKGLVASSSSKISVQNCVVNVGNIGLQLSGSPNSVVRNNTLVNGSVGIQFDSGSSSASVLNNLMSGQSTASLIVNNGAQQWHRSNGNLYNPSGNVAAILNGTSYTKAQVTDKSLAQAWYNFDRADVSDNNSRRTGYAAEAQSMAFPPMFVDAANGDYRLLSTLGNALDAGAENTFQRAIISPAYDSLGTPRPQGNGYDVGAFESVGAAYAVFVLNQDFTTSAGVYKPDGTLVKTLFSARRMFAGTNVVFWNGLDDNYQVAPANTYTIKMIAHNVQYVWENVVGNSSVPNCGESVHNGFEPIKAMTFNGTTAFYTSGYNENHLELNRFDTTNPNKLTKIFGPKTLITTDSITDVAADGSNLYAMNSANVSIYSQSSLNVIRTVNTGGGNSHVEVQRNGNLLFVAKKSQNTIAIYDKNTGGQTGSISVSQPDDLSVTATGDLWVISGTSAIRYSVSANGGSAAQTISGFGNPIAIACSPVDGTVLVADACTWQVKAFNSGGNLIWTHGQAGGFANGPRVTSDRFYWVFQDQGRTFTTTFLQFQPDGTWWVGDTFLSRSLHFNMSRQLLHEINYQPHTYLGSVDVNNGSRVFNRFTEYNVDYSRPPQQAWIITNFWGYGLPAHAFGMEDGICSPITMNNGRTYALIYESGSNTNGWKREVMELTASGLRATSARDFGSYTRITKDGSLYGQSGNSSQTYWRKPFVGFDGNGNPQWGAQQNIASANVGSGYLTSDPLSVKFPLQTTNGTVVIFDSERTRTGYHLGGIKPGGNTWLWRAMPTFGPMDGKGGCDSWVEYGGNYHMVAGRNIFAGFHGEFFQDAGQAGQFMHYYDNGLFVGQFGQPLLFGVVVNPPGGSGNNFNPALVEVGTNLFLYHNDEPGRGSHRWKTVGASDIRELSSSITIGLPPMTNNPDAGTNSGTASIPTVTVNSTLPTAMEGGASGVITISRDSLVTSALTVNFSVSGSASAGGDYPSLGTSVTIPAGALFTTVTVAPIDDVAVEGTETVILTLNASANYSIGSPASATVSIGDNDATSGLPDVVVLGVSATPANPAPGQPVSFTATIKNQGATATPAATIVGVGFYVDGATVTSWVTKPQLQPGETATLTANDGVAGPYWNATVGTHNVTAVVDDVNRFAETIENNNSMAITLPVGVTNTAPPAVSLRPNGGQMTISWNSVPGKTYQVGYKPAMTNATWLPLGPLINATGTSTSYTDAPPAGTQQRFYNVRAQ